MTDRISKERRSHNMAAIKGKNTTPEIYVRKLLFSKGYRYRISSRDVPGHPDLYLAKYRATVFVNGCFWHRHEGCHFAYIPKSNVEFWEKKFNANIKRDHTVKDLLKQKGIRQLVIWECTINRMRKSEEDERNYLEQIEKFLHSDETYREL